MITYYFVRHGENRANLTKEFSYRLVDYPLTEKGVLQAQQTAAHFREQPIDAIFTSPLRRARQTAAIIGAALGLEPVVLESLREVNVGTLELEPPTPETWRLHNAVVAAWQRGEVERTFPGGESQRELLGRMESSLRTISAASSLQQVVIVAHGGLFRQTIKDLCTGEIDCLLETESHNCSITTVELPVGAVRGGRLIAWARHDHLVGAAAQLVSGAPDVEYWAPG